MIRSESAARRSPSRPEAAVKILLLSMPDSFEHTPTLTIRMPNGALASLAGNVDPHHRVAVADLVLVQSSVRQHGRAARRRDPAGRGRPLRDDVPAIDGAANHRTGSRAEAGGPYRRRRLRSQPGPRGMDRSSHRRRRHRPRRRGRDLSRADTRARTWPPLVRRRRHLVPREWRRSTAIPSVV